MPISKPTFPGISATQLKEGFDKLKNTMEQVQQRNGKVDMATLKREVERLDDPTVKAAFESIKDEFTVEKRRRVSSGCGTTYRTTRQAPTQLKSDQVQSVFSALIDAKAKTTQLDKDKNLTIDEKEAGAASQLQGLSGKMVKAAIDGNLGDYKAALEAWNEHLELVAEHSDERRMVEGDIESLCDYHCKYKNGASALKWAFREIATRGEDERALIQDNMEKTLEVAERGSRSENPLLRYLEGDSVSLAKGHLDNSEVRDLLNTRDLEGFAKKMKDKVEKRVGMKYEEWLEGKDLVGSDDVDSAGSSGGCGSRSSSSSGGC